jgi:hypothetical protein
MGRVGQRHTQVAFHSGKSLSNHRAGSHVGPTSTLDGCGEEKFLDPTGVKLRTVQLRTSRFGPSTILFCPEMVLPLIN